MSFRTISGEGQATTEIKRSVFICHLKPIETYDEGLEYVKAIAEAYPDARHNCYAFLTRDGGQKFSDNGEPQGTAGIPMTEVLKKRGLTDVACVVTRYFGGIKLGTGGLAAAYSQAVKDALDATEEVEKAESIVRAAEMEYNEYQVLQRAAENFGAKTEPPAFGQRVTLTFFYPAERDEEWQEKEKQLFSGKTKSVIVEKTYKIYKIND